MVVISSNLLASEIKFNFKMAEITAVLETYSKAAGQKMIIDPSVRGKISIFNPGPIPMEEALDQLSSALAINGYSLVKRGDIFIVLQGRAAQRDGIEVGTDLPNQKPERMYSWVFKLKNIPAYEFNKYLRTLTSKDGNLEVFEPSNQLILTDYTSNILRVAEIIKLIDQPYETKTKVTSEVKK